MEKEINIQILLEIALNQRISSDINNSLTQILNLYLIKLNCFSVGIYRNEDWDIILPKKIKTDKFWFQKITNFSQNIPNSNSEPVFKKLAHTHFYGFPLYEYGWLILIMKKKLSRNLYFELNKVVNQLGISLNNLKVEQKIELFQMIADKTSDEIQIVKESGSLYYVNEIASKKLDILPLEVSKYNVWDVNTFFKNKNTWNRLLNLLKIKGNNKYEHFNQVLGRKVPVELNFNLINSKGEIFIIIITKDIKPTQLKKNTLDQTLSSVFNEMSDVVWSLKLPSLEGLFVTPSVESIFEINADAFIKDISLWEKIILKEDINVIGIIKKSLRKHGKFDVKYRIITPSGVIKWIRNKGKVIFNQELTPIRIDGIIVDNTKRYLVQETLIDIASTYINLDLKFIEATINQSLEKMGLFVSCDRAYVFFDNDFENNSTLKAYKWCREGIEPKIEKVQNKFNDYIFKRLQNDKNTNAFYIQNIESLDSEIERELKSILEQQEIKTLIVIPIQDGNNLVGFVGFESVINYHHYSDKEQQLLFLFSKMLINIKNRQKWDNQLRLQEEKYRNIIANMNLGLLEVDLKDIIIYANQTFCNISGYDKNELIGKNATELLVEKKYKRIINEKHLNRIKNQSDNYEIEILNKTGEKRWWFISGAPNYNDKGQLIGSIGIHLDVTEQKKLEVQKEQLLKKLEKQNEQLSEYAQIVSHDLKSPLRSIYSLVTFIKEDNEKELTSKTFQYLTMIETKIEKMDHLINGILTYSKVDSDSFLYESIDLNDIVFNCLKIIYIPQSVNINILNQLPVITADKFRMQQLFQNIISNSVNYIDKIEGKVSIGSYENVDSYTIFVKDNGIGIAKKNQQKIFNIFQSFSDLESSTGIGLSIVKRIVDNYNGSISIESELNVGTTIFISLPKIKNENHFSF